MIDLGYVKPGRTIRIPFGTFAGATGASVTATGLAAADVRIYKDGGTTERASTAGITVTTDFDALTGMHMVEINLADNTTAGFYAAGSEYIVAIADITVDSQTVRFPHARFRIGYPEAVLNTSIATLASQTSFTLTGGPAEDSALVGCMVCLHDVASAVQIAFGEVLAYTGSTRTVTLALPPTFTIAASDNIAVFLPRHGTVAPTTLRGTVSTSSTTTSVTTSAMTPATSVADQLKGRVILFDRNTATAALRGQGTTISASSASATPTLTVAALTTAPASGDTFTIV